jgi:hypothetical protein
LRRRATGIFLNFRKIFAVIGQLLALPARPEAAPGGGITRYSRAFQQVGGSAVRVF